MTTLHEIVNTHRPKYTAAAPIVCKDGFSISVQASPIHYCGDANGKRGIFNGDQSVLPFTSVECGFPSERPEPWDVWEEYAETPEDPEGTLYGWVPVALIRDLLESHGGES